MILTNIMHETHPNSASSISILRTTPKVKVDDPNVSLIGIQPDVSSITYTFTQAANYWHEKTKSFFLGINWRHGELAFHNGSIAPGYRLSPSQATG